jgi:hypothetical protein
MEMKEMKELLDKIVDVTYKADSFLYKTPVKAKPNGPASGADLRRLDAFLGTHGFRAPASYRTCLSVYNGIRGFLSPDYSLLSVDEVIAKTKLLSSRYDDEFPDLVQFVIAAGETPKFMAFDVTTSADGEGYEVGEVTGEGRGFRYKNFKKFLTELLRNLEQTVRDEEKDRKKLKP